MREISTKERERDRHPKRGYLSLCFDVSLFLRVNPVAPTRLKQILSRVLTSEGLSLPPSALDVIIQNSNGDIRNALHNLQFMCLNSLSSLPNLSLPAPSSASSTGPKKKGKKEKQKVEEANIEQAYLDR